MRSNTRILVILLVAAPLIGGALIIQRRVAENYRRDQAALREYNRRQAYLQELSGKARQRDERIAELRRAVDLNPTDVRARWTLADAYQKAAMLEKAGEQIDAVIKLEANSKDARLARANIYLALGKLREAEASYGLCTKRWPKEVEAWQGLAASRYHQRSYREAADAASKALRLDPNDYGNRYVLACSALEYASQFPPSHVQEEAVMTARSLFQRLTKDEPKNADLWHKLGRACSLILDRNGAVDSMRHAYELAPDRADVAMDLAQTSIATGDRATATKVTEESLIRFPNNPGLHYTLSDLLQTTKEPDAKQRSLDEARKAVEFGPREPLFLERMGAAYLALGNLGEARKAYETSLKVDANRARPYQQLAAIYTRLGDSRRGSIAAKMATRMVYNDQTLRQVQELSSKYTDAVPLKLILADRYRDLKMTGAARDTYLEILQLDPKNDRAKAGLAAIATQQQLARIPVR